MGSGETGSAGWLRAQGPGTAPPAQSPPRPGLLPPGGPWAPSSLLRSTGGPHAHVPEVSAASVAPTQLRTRAVSQAQPRNHRRACGGRPAVHGGPAP